MSSKISEVKLLIKKGNEEEILQLPIERSSIGPDAINITKLYKSTGLFTYDPGFMSTASCTSSITFIDGDLGILTHRGYPVSELAQNNSFLDVSYLLINDELPDAKKSQEFANEIYQRSKISDQAKNIFLGFQKSAHPMPMLMAAMACLASETPSNIISTAESRTNLCYDIIAKISVMASYAYKYTINEPFQEPKKDLSFSANLLHMLFSKPGQEYIASAEEERAIDTLLILHADHEQNASTSTVRVSGSSKTNPYSAIASGISSLWGALHGGANEAVINMLEEIGSVDNIPHYINKAKSKEDPFRLMGFGHRVYKNYDPRATVIKTICDQFKSKVNDNLLEIAFKLEEIALKDDYFIERKLYPNVDFYSGIIYKYFKIPSEMFTVMFAIARSSGWISQWKEMIEDPEFRIARPRQLYKGSIKN